MPARNPSEPQHHRATRTLVIEPATSSLDNTAAWAAGVTARSAVDPAVAAVAKDKHAASAGARRGELLAVGFGGGSGARVADTDMGAMDGFGSPCSLPTRTPHCDFHHTRHAGAAVVRPMARQSCARFPPHTSIVWQRAGEPSSTRWSTSELRWTGEQEKASCPTGPKAFQMLSPCEI